MRGRIARHAPDVSSTPPTVCDASTTSDPLENDGTPARRPAFSGARAAPAAARRSKCSRTGQGSLRVLRCGPSGDLHGSESEGAARRAHRWPPRAGDPRAVARRVSGMEVEGDRGLASRVRRGSRPRQARLEVQPQPECIRREPNVALYTTDLPNMGAHSRTEGGDDGHPAHSARPRNYWRSRTSRPRSTDARNPAGSLRLLRRHHRLKQIMRFIVRDSSPPVTLGNKPADSVTLVDVEAYRDHGKRPVCRLSASSPAAPEDFQLGDPKGMRRAYTFQSWDGARDSA
jgi:hypothetical protein